MIVVSLLGARHARAHLQLHLFRLEVREARVHELVPLASPRARQGNRDCVGTLQP